MANVFAIKSKSLVEQMIGDISSDLHIWIRQSQTDVIKPERFRSISLEIVNWSGVGFLVYIVAKGQSGVRARLSIEIEPYLYFTSTYRQLGDLINKACLEKLPALEGMLRLGGER